MRGGASQSPRLAAGQREGIWSTAFVEYGRIADGDEKALGSEEPRRRLTPRFDAGIMKQTVTLIAQLSRRSRHIVDFEFNACLWYRYAGRPFGLTKAGLSCFGEWPKPEMANSEFRGVHVVPAVAALKFETEAISIEGLGSVDVANDRSDTRYELHLHRITSCPANATILDS